MIRMSLQVSKMSMPVSKRRMQVSKMTSSSTFRVIEMTVCVCARARDRERRGQAPMLRRRRACVLCPHDFVWASEYDCVRPLCAVFSLLCQGHGAVFLLFMTVSS